MYWLTARNAVVLVHRWRSVSFLLCPSLHRPFPPAATPQHIRQSSRVFCFRERKLHTKTSKKVKQSKVSLEEKDYVHVVWWKERLEMCRKPSSVQLVKRLTFSNLLGVDSSLKNGSLKEGNLNLEMLQFKSKFPREVLLCRNLRQTLDDLTRNGFSVCIVEEVQGPTHACTRKSRFISGHAHPGSSYVFGLVGDDYDLDFPDPMPVVGILYGFGA